MHNDSPLRNPPRVVRAMLAAGAFAVPGAMVGLMLALFLPFRFILMAAGIVVGALAGYLIELH